MEWGESIPPALISANLEASFASADFALMLYNEDRTETSEIQRCSCSKLTQQHTFGEARQNATTGAHLPAAGIEWQTLNS